MELSNILCLCFILFFINDNSAQTGQCWDEYSADISSENDVLYVCTNSIRTNTTDIVYMDMASVPQYTNSTCYCTITFAKTGTNRVGLDYKISGTGSLVVNVFGDDRFSASNTHQYVNSSITNHNVTFTLTSPEKGFKSCLVIRSKPLNDSGDNYPFNAKCHSSLDTPTGDVTPFAPATKTSDYLTTGSAPLQGGPDTDTAGPSVAVLGGGIGGAALFFVILAVVIAIVIIKRRKNKTTTGNNEDYYITENDLYNARNSSVKSANKEPCDTYDEIEAANQTRESMIYAEVDNDESKPAVKTKMHPATNENEYNHLNDFKSPISTGNVYSSAGRRVSEPGSNIYNITTNGNNIDTHFVSSEDHVYNTGHEY